MIYFDNSATTYPKPSSVLTQAYYGLRDYSFNSGRGGYAESLKAANKIFEVREKLGEMFGFNPSNIVFTKNCTEALNIAIKGVLRNNDHVIISSLEHNSVSRVVESLKETRNISYDIARYSYNDDECVENFSKLIRDNTRAIVCMHSSNAFGVTFPIAKIGKLCKSKGLIFVVDAAQGAGVAPINAKSDNIDILCSAGHKCLYGTMGTGFLGVKDGLELSTLMQGGTGSNSLNLYQPDFLPDRFEAGTLNNSGIISLGSGVDFINKVGMRSIYLHELVLARFVHNEFENMDKVKLYTLAPIENKAMPIISFNVAGYSSEAVASHLAKNNICVRAGYHCSPLAHKHFQTLETGTVRISFGYFNKQKECDKLLNIIKKM